MKLDGKVFAKKMEIFHNIFLVVIKKYEINLKKIFLGIVIAVMATILIEYLFFVRKFYSLPQHEVGVIVLEGKDIATEGFLLKDGQYVSQQQNGVVVININGRYVNNLELEIIHNPNDRIFAKFLDHTIDKERIIENRTQKNILKAEEDFLKKFVFHIDASPQEIRVEFPVTDTQISQISIDNNYYFNVYRVLFIFSALLTGGFLIFFAKPISQKPEYGFLVIALLGGGLLALAQVRSYVSWDEFIHYKNADKISLKGIFEKKVDDIYAKTNSVPHSHSLKEQIEIDRYFDAKIKENAVKKKKKNSYLSFNYFYNKIGYLPSALGLMLGRILHLPGHVIFMFGRLANLLAYAAVVFWAIRKIPVGKLLMAVIALFPTALFLASSYSYDPWVTAFIMLGMAYLVAELKSPQRRISLKNAAIMTGSFIVGLGPKAIYFPLILPLFLLGRDKFVLLKQYKKYLLVCLATVALVAGSFMVPFVIKGPGEGDSRGGELVNSAEQVRFILTEPLEYAEILLRFTGEYLSVNSWSGFVTSFAYLGSIEGFWLILLALFAAFVLEGRMINKQEKSVQARILMTVIFFVTVFLISTALYVAFTAVRLETIAGVQPRYLLPLIFPLLLVWGQWDVKINQTIRMILTEAIFLITGGVLFKGIWEVIIGKYF